MTPAIVKPGIYQATTARHRTLMAKEDNPNVRIVSGNVNSFSTGRMVLLINPSVKAAIKAVRISRIRNCPGKIWSIIRWVIRNAIAFSTQLISNLSISGKLWGMSYELWVMNNTSLFVVFSLIHGTGDLADNYRSTDATRKLRVFAVNCASRESLASIGSPQLSAQLFTGKYVYYYRPNPCFYSITPW